MGETDENDMRDILKRQANLNKTISQCTRKVSDNSGEYNSPGIILKIGVKRRMFHFRLKLKDEDIIFEFPDATANVIYCVFVHYSYVLLTGQKLILHKLIYNNSHNNWRLKTVVV